MKLYQRHCARVIIVYSFWFSLIAVHLCQASTGNPSGKTLRIISNEETPAILTIIANEIRDNYEQISTWSGEIDVKINWLWTGTKAKRYFRDFTDAKGEAPESILQKVEQRVTFAVDTKKEFLHVDTLRENPSKFFDSKSGRDLGNGGAHPHWSTLIVKPDFLIRVTPQALERKENKIIRRKAEKKTSRRESSTESHKHIIHSSDPRREFFPSGEFAWNNLDRLVKRIEKFGKIEFDGYSLSIEECQKGDTVEYKVIQPSVVSLERSDPNHYVILTKVFSSQYGFNMIYWEAASGGGIPIQEFSWEYELIGGVYLPKKVTKINYMPNGEIDTKKEYNYANTKLNREIPPDTFEYTNLKLREGDIFIDKILNKEYRYEENTQTLKPIEK